MLKVEYQGQFKKDFKLAIKRGCDHNLFPFLHHTTFQHNRMTDSRYGLTFIKAGLI